MNPSEPDTLTQLSAAETAVVMAFKSAYRSLDRRKGRETRRVGGSEVSQAQFEVLVELRKHGPTAVGELAQSLGLSAASVSQMVDRLSEEGHVTRVRSDEDRRVVKVELSDSGRESLDPIIERWRQSWRSALSDLPEADLEATTRVLSRIAAIYEETPGD